MLSSQISKIQGSLAEMQVDGWFFACFQHNDPVSRELLGLDDRHVSRRLPAKKEELLRIRDLHPRQIQRHGDVWLEMIAEARDRPPHELPEASSRLPRSEAVGEALERLAEVVRVTAESLEIPPPALASRRELKQLLLAAQEGKAVNGASPPPPFDGWRWEVLGEPVEKLVSEARSAGWGR